MTAKENKFLKVKNGVVLTSSIEPVIIALDKYFEGNILEAWVTSGLRNPENQLKIIRDYLKKTSLSKLYPDTLNKGLNDKIIWNEKNVYAWQPGWSALLHSGIIINPPIAAECLMDYYSNGVNKKGQVIQASVHFIGAAFDIGGGADGIDGNVANELKVVQKAFSEKLKGLKSYVIERNNNCLHINCY